ncbi:DTW domain-containing protein [Catenovulum sp. 2E275]|uniref:tRNA-uridine aminocarboxypropyltransferase n=1 Tax=Catenovulum sp. 2E275 TaxID=2980497 RepID=UPI0021CEE4F2|nr:DTW domain-containing protein [Catenovulum sp. 2E275]MCU4677459.1 DTW domain-containing protein [Catenovulum sp. 2E275]
MTNLYAFNHLRKNRLAKATRPFLARGILQKRCSQCLLADFACICEWKKTVNTKLDVILLMHTDEILKPTNTGRLISDILPDNCFAFEWARTEPDPKLLALLNDPKRFVIIVYPAQQTRASYSTPPNELVNGKKLTLVVIDGTWRQSKKIFNLSQWLQSFPTLDLNIAAQANYGLRKAPHPDQLSTAEAGAIALAQCNEQTAAQLLDNYFAIFNQHYSASRANKIPEQTAAHQFIKNS